MVQAEAHPVIGCSLAHWQSGNSQTQTYAEARAAAIAKM